MKINLSAEHQPIRPAVAITALLLAALWGGTPTAVHFAVDELPPLLTAGVRFALASLFMLLWCRFENSQLPVQRGQGLPILINGLLLFLQIGLFTIGIAQTSASHASVLINTYVFWVAGIDHILTKFSRLSVLRIAGLIFAAAGGMIALLVTEAPSSAGHQMDQPTRTGDFCLAGSAFVLGIKIVYMKVSMRNIEPGKLMLWHDLVGMSLFFISSLAFEQESLRQVRSLHIPTVVGLFYQGVVVSGFCFAAQAALLKRHSAAGISIFSVATPLFGVTIAVLLRGDRLSPWLGVGGVCVALGIYLVNRRRPEPPMLAERNQRR